MTVKEIMPRNCKIIRANASLMEAAQQMLKLDCGFLPVADSDNNDVIGVITDRDIVLRGVAANANNLEMTVGQILTEEALCCYCDDDIETAAESMRENKVYRLVVLDSPNNKQFAGIVSLGDVMRHDYKNLGGDVAGSICKAA